jgi:hypothetical protein
MLKLILFTLVAAQVASAQTADEKTSELSIEGGTFLPSRIYKTREILNGVDFRATLPTGKGKFEIDAFFANSEGINYRIVSVDYRVDLGFDEFPAFMLVGVHGDFWTPAEPYNVQQYSGGWHFGGGFLQPLFGGWSAREDFRYRLGPGTSLVVGLGFNYQFSN